MTPEDEILEDEKFERLAASVKTKILARLGTSIPSILTELERIVAEWRSGNLTTRDSSIGLSGVKLFDSCVPEDLLLSSEMSDLGGMYRRRARRNWIRQRQRNP